MLPIDSQEGAQEQETDVEEEAVGDSLDEGNSIEDVFEDNELDEELVKENPPEIPKAVDVGGLVLEVPPLEEE